MMEGQRDGENEEGAGEERGCEREAWWNRKQAFEEVKEKFLTSFFFFFFFKFFFFF